MKKKWSYLLFIPALLASYYFGAKSEKAFKESFQAKHHKDKEPIRKKASE